jgi:hypothetical protein
VIAEAGIHGCAITPLKKENFCFLICDSHPYKCTGTQEIKSLTYLHVQEGKEKRVQNKRERHCSTMCETINSNDTAGGMARWVGVMFPDPCNHDCIKVSTKKLLKKGVLRLGYQR